MPTNASGHQRPSRDLFALLGFVALCLLVSGIGGAITATSVGGWYQALQKPPFNPPDWVFAPVWTPLYILIAVSGWRIWRHRLAKATGKAFSIYAVQLALNLAWSGLFFGWQRIDLALIEVVILLCSIIVNSIVFWRIDRTAGLLLIPYILCVAYATALNGALWLLNPAN